MCILSKILIKYFILICNIFTICFVLYTKQLLANDNTKYKNQKLTRQIIQLVEENKFNKVKKLIADNADENYEDLVNWLKFSSKNIDNELIEEIVKKYQNWPNINNIIIHIENTMSWKYSENKVFNIFDMQSPITNIGRIKYAKYSNEKDNQNNDRIIINSWINGSFKKEDELYIYKNYSYLFDEKINNIRLNNLIWNKKWASVYRQLKRVSKDYQILAKAKIKLSRREYGVDYAIKIIPDTLNNDPGLVYERVKWRRVSGLTNESYNLLIKHLRENSQSLIQPHYWWTEINWHTRNLLNQKEYNKAYELLRHHQQNKISNIASAEWLLGWISLEFLNKPNQAKKHFLNMKDIVKMPISISRVNYWLGKTEEYLLNSEKSKSFYESAAIYNTTYYGLLANAKLNKKINFKLIDQKLTSEIPDEEFIKKLSVLKLLSLANEKKYSIRFINGLFATKISKNEVVLILNVLKDVNRTDLFIRACKKATQIDASFQKYLFPYPNNINHALNEPLITAIAKQESEFYPNAISRSGALGIVQVMPSTAKNTAKKLGIKYNKKKLLNDIDYNIHIGSKYLYSLIDYYDGSKILAIASYNAGPTNVNKWIKQYGDPRNIETNAINWIELIPFNETRNYVQRVIENYIIYQQVFINAAIKNKVNINELF